MGITVCFEYMFVDEVGVESGLAGDQGVGSSHDYVLALFVLQHQAHQTHYS